MIFEVMDPISCVLSESQKGIWFEDLLNNDTFAAPPNIFYL